MSTAIRNPTRDPAALNIRFWSVARRPRWIAALLLALGVAAGFAALGQWQLARSIAAPVADVSSTETPAALTSVATPDVPVTDPELGHMITTTATLVPGDFVVLIDRLNFGAAGFWLVGHATSRMPRSELRWSAATCPASRPISRAWRRGKTVPRRYRR